MTMAAGERIGQERAPSEITVGQPGLPNIQNRLLTKQQLPRTSGQIASIQCHWRCNFSYYISFFALTVPGDAERLSSMENEPAFAK
jgi:hypothetical protein